MARVYNFSAGPSALPESLLAKAASELVEFPGAGMSVMEMSHRSKDYQAIIDETEANIRTLMGIPDCYRVLFLQGGASLQFAMVPLNLMGKHKKAMYINTGVWTKKAIKEAKRIGTVEVGASSEADNFTFIPKAPAAPDDVDYYYICSNNTIYGTKWNQLPEVGSVPLVADMSSCIMSEPVDVSKYGLIFAGAQKNLGPAGVTLVIVRDDLIHEPPEALPTMLAYKTHADAGSMFNTPPTYGIYMIGLMMKWISQQGGIEGIYQQNLKKAALLYDFLDESKLFHGTVNKADRSLMNVPFITDNEALNAQFIAEASAAGFKNLKGHRSVGGMRASIYNAVSTEAVRNLVAFMAAFEKKNR